MSEITLVYGASSSSKTTLCGQFHRYESNRLQAPGLHVTLDSSVEPMMDEIQEGRVRIWHLGYEQQSINSSLLNALHRLAAGYTPKDIDPVTGQRVSDNWNYNIRGAMSVEGVSLISDALLRYMAIERGQQNVKFVEVSGQAVGGAYQATYSDVKTAMVETITKMKGLPGAQRVLWTAHEGVGTDMQQANTLGPAMTPSKGIDKIPALFAHSLRTESITFMNEEGKPEQGKLIHFDPHVEPKSGLKWPCKVSMSPARTWALRKKASDVSNGVLPGALLARLKDGKLVGGITDFLEFLDSKTS